MSTGVGGWVGACEGSRVGAKHRWQALYWGTHTLQVVACWPGHAAPDMLICTTGMLARTCCPCVACTSQH